jgi:predicted HTH transcriptional regulator
LTLLLQVLKELSNSAKSFTLIRSNDTTNDTINDTIKNRQNEMIGLIKKVPTITRKEIAQTFNISEPTVARDLKLLQELGIIKRNGSNKTGYWEVINGKF